jgi:hypothetical protein
MNTKSDAPAGGSDKTAKAAPSGAKVPVQPVPTGLQSNGEFRIGDHIILGMRGNDVLIRHSPQGDEVHVSEGTVASVLIDAFFNPQNPDYQKNIAQH